MKPWIFAAGAVLLAGGCMKPKSIFSEEPHVVGKSQVEIGAYLAEVGGCHDCHTPGWAQAPGNVPEDQLLAGSPVGFSGPWGTSYPANLRVSVQASTAEEWADMMKDRNGLPPMPWSTVNHMSRADLMAIHAYINSLGEGGNDIPMAVTDGSGPHTPYIWFMPEPPENHPANR
jgi:mono/diheme cytochrome c family protein